MIAWKVEISQSNVRFHVPYYQPTLGLCYFIKRKLIGSSPLFVVEDEEKDAIAQTFFSVSLHYLPKLAGDFALPQFTRRKR